MSIKTTHYISREIAIAVILSKINGCTNDELSNILEEFEESYFRNYIVLESIPDDGWNYTIKTINEF